MEALGAAASITQFVLLSLKCVKEAHDALSQYKDGPDILKRLRNDLLCAQNILETLRHSANVPANPVLDAHIQQSIGGICSIAEHLVKLQATPGDNGGKRLWKHLKIVLSENDMNRIRSELAQIVNNLNVRLSVLSLNTVSGIMDETQQVRQQMTTMDALLQSHYQLQTAGFQAVENNLLTTHNEHHIDYQNRLTSIQQALDSTSSISVSRFTDMRSLLNEIKDLVVSEGKATRDASASNNVDSDSTRNEPQNSAILESIERLGALINAKRESCNVYAEEDDLADSAIEDLQDLLTAIRREKHFKIEKEMLDGLRRFSRSFGQYEVSINSRNNGSRQVTGRILDQERTHKQADIGLGQMSLMIHKRKRTLSTEDERDTTGMAKGHLTDYNMSLTFLPNGSRNHHMLMATITQREILAGSIASVSQLQVNRVLPSNSPVFKLVKQGKIEELCQLFQSGKASLRDHDEAGSSLLFYSLEQPEMCKFLLEEGLDVDHVAYEKGALFTPEVYGWNDTVIPDQHLKRINACRKLLLNAGADPTYKDPNNEGSKSFLDTVRALPDRVVQDTIDFAWNSGLVTPFASFRDWTNYEGMSTFLNACTHFKISVDILKHLVAMGANVYDRSSKGETCLHLLVNHTPPETEIIARLECLAYLLQQGADPYARDNEGNTPSSIAYSMMGHRDTIDGTLGDVWDAALHTSGFDLSHFRKTFRRRPRYDYSFYTRQMFEELWRGREDQCPYWDDEPWPPLGPGERNSDHDSDINSYGCVSDFDVSDDGDQSEEDDEEDEDGGALL
ncbi:unnamed protein product [Fusarium graminearum]|nr:unnamed protein product [Fusarium graminearum]